MTANATDSRPIDCIGAAQSVSANPGPPHPPGNGRGAAAAAVQLSAFESRGRAPGTSRRRRAFESRDRVRVAAAAMGWFLWVLLVLLMAAFLAFAPSLLATARAQDSETAMAPAAPQSLTATAGDEEVVLTTSDAVRADATEILEASASEATRVRHGP